MIMAAAGRSNPSIIPKFRAAAAGHDVARRLIVGRDEIRQEPSPLARDIPGLRLSLSSHFVALTNEHF
jgi:hypothetical protein